MKRDRPSSTIQLRGIDGADICCKEWDHTPMFWEVMFQAKCMRPGKLCKLLYNTVEWRPSMTLANLVGDISGVIEITVVFDRTSVMRNLFFREAYAALKTDGSVVTWGDNCRGGNSSAVKDLLVDVVEITGNTSCYAAVRIDGSVVVWGDKWTGGDFNGSDVYSLLQDGVVHVAAAAYAFAAIKSDGSVVTWGHQWGGDSSSVASLLQRDVIEVIGNSIGFVALKSDGKVVQWGRNTAGCIVQFGVVHVAATGYAFAALKNDGSVVTWSADSLGLQVGADSSKVLFLLQDGLVKEIIGNEQAFTAIKMDGSVVVWGHPNNGGDISSVESFLQRGVVEVIGSSRAFAARKDDGSVVTWGNSDAGGDSSSVRTLLQSDVTQVVAAAYAFAAIKSDGSVVVWGNEYHGGTPRFNNGYGRRGSVKHFLEDGVVQVVGSEVGFAAVKDDGFSVSWGFVNMRHRLLDNVCYFF